mgnify:CR=1 FL=1
MNIVEIIVKKKNKLELTNEEIDFAFNGYLNKKISDAQMSALLMAIVINGMSFSETAHLTEIFINSGEVYDLSGISKPCVDKHSTGGVGDTTTLIVGPILASCGIVMAKMSGRGLGHTGGTIDKLESIPGFNTNLTKDQFIKLADEVGFCISRQTDKLVPMDKEIYNLRNLTGTTESIPLIASSIMSKKIASGANTILIDIKVGDGALIKNDRDANVLSDWLIRIGEHFKRKVITIKTDMNKPLGDSIGNAIEVLEAVKVLKGKECRLKDVSVEIASKLLSSAKNISLDSALKEINLSIESGKAFRKFQEFVTRQGGDLSRLDLSDNVLEIKANKNGILKNVDALEVGLLAVKLGVNRTSETDNVDEGTGIRLMKTVGDEVSTGDVLAYLFVSNKVKLTEEDFNCFDIE